MYWAASVCLLPVLIVILLHLLLSVILIALTVCMLLHVHKPMLLIRCTGRRSNH